MSKENKKTSSMCKISKHCGGCSYIDMPYEKQLDLKQTQVRRLLEPYLGGNKKILEPIIGMKNPFHYRNKVNAAFGHDKNGNPISGMYEAESHRILQTDSCFLEDETADAIIVSIRSLLKSFKILTYNENSDYGLLRHVMVRRGKTSGEVMVVLVVVSPIFPSKNNFVKALRKIHPEITTIILNINDKDTSMVLGEKNITIYGKGYITDSLCGIQFRISPSSFYQINSVQTEILYTKAMEFAGLMEKDTNEAKDREIEEDTGTGINRVKEKDKEKDRDIEEINFNVDNNKKIENRENHQTLKKQVVIMDAYCGIGTISLIAAKYAKSVIGVELNRTAVHDAVVNMRQNHIENAVFVSADAGAYMERFAGEGAKIDILFLDPPRSGSTEQFIQSMAIAAPKKVVYVSCNPETLARDLKLMIKKGYCLERAVPVDMFPHCKDVETVCLLSRIN